MPDAALPEALEACSLQKSMTKVLKAPLMQKTFYYRYYDIKEEYKCNIKRMIITAAKVPAKRLNGMLQLNQY